MVSVLLVATGCNGSTRTATAPTVTVVTGLWPLAATAAEIGQGNVTAVDVVPPGDDPRAWDLSRAAVAQVHRAGLVLEMGGAFQPSFEAAAAGSAHTVRLTPAGGSPYVWLNPHTMEQAAATIAGALVEADPGAAATFRTGLANVLSNLGSLDADYESTLSTCPDHTLVTVDRAFAVLGPRYPVVDTAIVDGPLTPTPPSVTVRKEVAAIRATGVNKIYNDSWIPESDILGATAEAHVQVGTIDTLEGPPTTAPWAYSSGRKYVSLMEANLAVISSALQCPNADNN